MKNSGNGQETQIGFVGTSLARLENQRQHPSFSGNGEDTVVIDTTTLRPHPTRKIFLTSSNEFVKIFDSRTGELLQMVVAPLIRFNLMGKPKMTHGQTVLSADWSKDGRALYVFSANHRSVSLWKLID